MDHLAHALDKIIAVEGGFSNHKSDSGGATKFGITEALARKYGYFGAMTDMSRAMAIHIYQQEFWFPLQCGQIAQISPTIAYELFDTAVNQGPGVAARYLQRSLNVLNRRQSDYPDLKVDGSVGPVTLAALRTFMEKRKLAGELVLFRMLNALQGAFYVELCERREKDEDFIYGWFMHRIT